MMGCIAMVVLVSAVISLGAAVVLGVSELCGLRKLYWVAFVIALVGLAVAVLCALATLVAGVIHQVPVVPGIRLAV